MLAVKAKRGARRPAAVAGGPGSRGGAPLVLVPVLVRTGHLAIAGLAATTVGAIRERSTVQSPQLNTRMLAATSRLRPVSALDGRRRASEIIAARPDASLREVAREAGISLGTAHNVRERMRRGEDCGLRPGADAGVSVRDRAARAAATARRAASLAGGAGATCEGG